MNRKIIINDLKKNKLLSVTTFVFMAVSAFLFALTIILYGNLCGAIDELMLHGKTPHFLQMHAGAISEEKIIEFAEKNDKIETFQIMEFLNLESGKIYLNGRSLADSTQDNGLCVQSEHFDYLLDLQNRIIEVKEGEIYVPVSYRQEYGLRTGEKALIAGESFIIAGFLRDSQMNSMLASSKRFLVCMSDYEKLKPEGNIEYLIEFILKDVSALNVFSTEYAEAGLSANGPAITYHLIRTMNTLSDGLMIGVILLVSMLVVFISMLCIRFTLLAKLEEDIREIGMLRAIGISQKDIKKIYLGKYIILSCAGTLAGLTLAYFLKEALLGGIREIYGTADNRSAAGLFPVLGALLVEGVILLYVNRILNHIGKISALAAVRGHAEEHKVHSTGRLRLSKSKILPVNLLLGLKDLIYRRKLYLVSFFVIAAGAVLMVIPQNLYSSISSEKFATYMGIGDSEIRIDVQQTDETEKKTKRLEDLLSGDERVAEFVTLTTKSFRMIRKDGSFSNIKVELGDHETFPVSYSEGRAPKHEADIALSALNAEESGIAAGDLLTLVIDGEPRILNVCGIYSDITNGGKTAKASFSEESAPVMWSIFYVALQDERRMSDWINEYKALIPNEKVTDIKAYIVSTYGQTMRSVHMAATLAMYTAVGIIFLILLLFMRLLLAKDRFRIALLKSYGFTDRDIRRQYLSGNIAVLLAGTFAGVLLGTLLGEKLTGILLSAFGADGFQFIINPFMIAGAVPVLTLLTVALAVYIGTGDVKRVGVSECINGQG